MIRMIKLGIGKVWEYGAMLPCLFSCFNLYGEGNWCWHSTPTHSLYEQILICKETTILLSKLKSNSLTTRKRKKTLKLNSYNQRIDTNLQSL